MQYEVTIGIPVFNSIDYIQQTMESALSQSYENIEYLVVDDCSEDGSITLVEKLQLNHPRGRDIRILYHDKNLGVGVSRNQIIREARGRSLFFLDSDDLIEPTAIERLACAMREHNADVVYGSWKRIDKVNNQPHQYSFYPNMCLLESGDLAMFAFYNYSSFRISVCNCLFSMMFLRSEGLRFIDAIFWEDLAFTYEMVTKVKRAVLLPTITYNYICRPGSLSHYQDREFLQKEEIINNAQTISYLKQLSLDLINEKYIPYLSYNLEVNSFYVVCYILKHYQRITPKFSLREMGLILCHPLSFGRIVRFRHKVFQNLFFWFLGKIPPCFSMFVVYFLGKFKKVI